MGLLLQIKEKRQALAALKGQLQQEKLQLAVEARWVGALQVDCLFVSWPAFSCFTLAPCSHRATHCDMLPACLPPLAFIVCTHTHTHSYHAKELAAANQTSKRLQQAQLHRMQQELQLLEQQLDLEGAVCTATVSFLNSKASSLQDDSVSWHARREEDAQNKEREVEVSRWQRW